MTFVPHPSEVVRPGSHPPVLTTIVRRAELVEDLGVDVFCALPFTLEFSQLPPDEFVHHALVDRLHASAVVVGENFRFGHKAAGDVACWRGSGARSASPPTGVALLADGDTAAERDLRPLLRAGRRHRRRRRGARAVRTGSTASSSAATSAGASSASRPRTCGPTPGPPSPPTASTPGGSCGWTSGAAPSTAPPLGTAAISVGTNPTFEVRQRRVEAYVLDFDGDLYGDDARRRVRRAAARHGALRRHRRARRPRWHARRRPATRDAGHGLSARVPGSARAGLAQHPSEQQPPTTAAAGRAAKRGRRARLCDVLAPGRARRRRPAARR